MPVSMCGLAPRPKLVQSAFHQWISAPHKRSHCVTRGATCQPPVCWRTERATFGPPRKPDLGHLGKGEIQGVAVRCVHNPHRECNDDFPEVILCTVKAGQKNRLAGLSAGGLNGSDWGASEYLSAGEFWPNQFQVVPNTIEAIGFFSQPALCKRVRLPRLLLTFVFAIFTILITRKI